MIDDASIEQKQKDVENELSLIPDWEGKYKYLIELGKAQTGLPDESKTEENKVRGCQSQVWLDVKLSPDGKMYIGADSDALIIRGLIGLLLRVYSGHAPKEILENPPNFFSRIGMQEHLSITRANGLAKIIKQIQFYALAYSSLK